MNVDWKELVHVALAGAIGGVLCWIYSEATGTPLGLGLVGSPLASLCLGAGAAVLGVYVVAKTDMSAKVQGLACAMACGFAWKPVLDGTTSLVETQVARASEASIRSETDEALSGSEALKASASDGEVLTKTVSSAVEALRHDARTTDVAEQRSIRLEDVVRNITSAEGLSDEDKVDAIGRIGSAATSAGDQTLAAISQTALAELGGDTNASPEVRAKASRAVTEIGDKGSMRRMPSLQVSSDVIQEAIRPGTTRGVREIFDKRFSRPPR